METKTRVAAIIIRNSKLLMLKGKGYEELWTPGGKIKKGESEEDCLKRELKEEIRAKLTKLKFFGEYSGKSFYHEYITKNRVYIVSIEGKIKPGAEIERVIWLTKNDFEKHKFPMIPMTENEIIPDLIKHQLFT